VCFEDFQVFLSNQDRKKAGQQMNARLTEHDNERRNRKMEKIETSGSKNPGNIEITDYMRTRNQNPA